MAELCEYVDIERMLRDKIVFSAHGKLQELLLRDNKLTLDNAVSICRAFELTKRQVQEMSSAEQMVDRVESHVSKQLRSGYQDKKTNDTKKECQYFGYSHEPGRRCPAWGEICSHCHGPNHFKAKSRKKINCVLETDDPENDDDWLQAHALTFGVTGDAKQKRITAMMEVNQCSIRFQLDTGTDIKTINQRFVRKDQVRQTGEKLVMWNGTKLTPKGTAKLMTTNVNTGTKDEVDFVVVDNGLTCLIGSTTIQAMGLMTIHGERFISKVDKVDDLGNLGMATLITDCDIAPKILPCRKIPIALQQGVKTELDTLVKRGILVPVDEPTQWVSQMAVVVKQNGSLRLCLDPQPLNQALMREHYKLSTLDDVLPSMNNAKIFSKLDVHEAFWHVELDEQSSILTTMITPYGRYRWARLPFGLKVSSEIFQKRLNESLEGINGVICVADDIIVVGCGTTKALAELDHDDNLKKLMQRCTERNIKLNNAKAEFKRDSVIFMGHKMTTEGIQAHENKVKAILEMPPPTDIHGVRRFCGMIQYLARFMPDMAIDLEPIRALTRQHTDWNWSKDCEDAFKRVKKKITTAPMLAYFNAEKELVLQVDSSQHGLGVALMQEEKPIEYASRSLTSTECR